MVALSYSSKIQKSVKHQMGVVKVVEMTGLVVVVNVVNVAGLVVVVNVVTITGVLAMVNLAKIGFCGSSREKGGNRRE